MQLTGRRCDNGQTVTLEIEGGRIRRIVPAAHAAAPWIAPAWVDLQINGYGGQEFSSPDLTPDHVATIVAAMNPFGVGRFLPTVTTASRAVLRHAMQTLAAACDQSPALERRIPGIHLEGPYISPEDGPRGAHPRAHCRPPDWDEFQSLQDAAGGRIRLITLAAEYPQAPEFVRRAVAAGVVVALGHMAPDDDALRAAVDAGASLSTHLGNGSHPILPRHPNYLWTQLAEDRLAASLIVDGHHLPPAVVKSFVRAKQLQRCMLVSDLSGMAGLPPGSYRTQLCDLEVLADGRVVVAGQAPGQRRILAGASQPIGVGVANLVRFAGVSLAEAVALATTNPARWLGIESGTLSEGQPADLVVFDGAGDDRPTTLTIRILRLIVAGEEQFADRAGTRD